MSAVFVGSSNTAGVGGAPWPELLCARRGWTMHNHAIGGSSYVYQTPFTYQISQAAAALSDAERSDVSHVFVGDASNNSRAKTPYHTVLTAARDLYAQIRQTFPAARIVVVPQIWPADTERYAPAIFGYDQQWASWCLAHAEAQREALAGFPNALFVDQTWTWLTGRDDLMIGPGDVHPSAAGHERIAALVDRALDGETIISAQPWTAVDLSAAAAAGGNGARWLGATRRGWTVQLDGSARWTQPSGWDWDIGRVAYGMRPTYPAVITVYRADRAANVSAMVLPTGHIRVHEPIETAGVVLAFAGTYDLS